MRPLIRQFRKKKAVLTALGIVLAMMIAYIWSGEYLETLLQSEKESGWLRPTAQQRLLSRVLTAVFTFWFFFVGATIGSFLNVVVYRMPLGKSVIFKPSHCPFCKASIKAWHNIPVFGWLSLNGRCRKCRLPISPRYPGVEFVCGIIFLLVFFVQLISGGANLPIREINEKTGVVRTVFEPQWDLFGLTFLHLFLFCALLTGSLIHWDGQRIPRRFWITTSTVCLLSVIAFPVLCLVPFGYPFAVSLSPIATAALTSLVGGTAGCLFGMLLRLIVRKPDDHRTLFSSPEGIVICLGLVGTFVGWQAIPFVALTGLVIASLIVLLRPAFENAPPVPWMMVMSLATFAHHLCWRWEYLLLPESQEISLITLGVTLLLGVVFAIGIRLLDKADPLLNGQTVQS